MKSARLVVARRGRCIHVRCGALRNVAAALDLALSLADRLTPEQQKWATEYLQAHEWGLALEMFADWLSEAGAAIREDERDAFVSLSTQMGNSQRVMTALADCPELA